MPSSHPTYPSLGDFYFADSRRLSSPECDLGLWWRMTSFGSPTFRAAYVEATGEIYVMQHEGLPGGGRIEVVATRDSLDAVLADLAGMDDVCGEPGSLWWLLDRLVPGERARASMPLHAERSVCAVDRARGDRFRQPVARAGRGR